MFVCRRFAELVLDWSIDGAGPDGKEVHLGGSASDVLRRGADGVWRYMIDNNQGTAVRRPAPDMRAHGSPSPIAPMHPGGRSCGQPPASGQSAGLIAREVAGGPLCPHSCSPPGATAAGGCPGGSPGGAPLMGAQA